MERDVVALTTDLSHFDLLVALAHLRTLLSVEVRGRSATHHLLRHVLVAAWTLVRVSELLVDRVLVARLLGSADVGNGHTVMSTHIPVALGHGMHVLRHGQVILTVLHVVPVVAILHHGSSVLVSHGLLCHHHLLLSSHITVVSSRLGVVLVAHGNHTSIVNTVLLALVQLIALRVTDEDDVVLVDSVVRARVAPLLVVAPPETSPRAIIACAVSHIRLVLTEVEQAGPV